MTLARTERDLVALCADLDMENALREILRRPEALGIRVISFDIFRHQRHDAGCLREGPEFLRKSVSHYKHAIILLDYDGCGREGERAGNLEADITQRLAVTGWDDRAHAIVIRPELEVWFWGDSPHVDGVLGWPQQTLDLREWLTAEGFLREGEAKPKRPKEALDAALRVTHKRRSSALFTALANKVSLDRCSDPSFLRLRGILREWFPPL